MSYIAKLAIVLGLITAVAAGALAYTNQLTAEQIAGQVQQAKEDALKLVLPGAVTFRPEPEMLAAAQAGDQSLLAVTEMFTGFSEMAEIGTAYSVTVTGYGGPVALMVGVDSSGAVAGMKIIDAANETPGLGARIKDPAFQGTFGGKTAAKPLSLVKSATSAEDEVQAIAAATISSSAVVRAVNAATAAYRATVGGGPGPDPKLEAATEIFPEADSVVPDPERVQTAIAEDPSLEGATDLYVIMSGEAVIGTAIAGTGQGYGGPVVALVGFDRSGTVAGVRFVSLSGETDGLGTRIAEPQFTSQFAGKPAGAFRVTTSAPAGADEIQAVSGATASSRGAVAAVNAAIRLYVHLGRP